ncbi:MAG: TonB-dependent receptor [Acidobacteria bacterium]|nr:TonB-dependent receptor [Acidobacteriota bacterium]
MNKFMRLPVWLLVWLVAVPSAFAQSTGTILGTVRDGSGGVLPGASVTIVQADTGWSRTVVADAQGNYIVPNLNIGTYRVTAEITGFERLVQSVGLQVGQQARIDFALRVGDVTDEVTVIGRSVLISTDDSTLGGVIGQQQIAELPLDGRNFAQLAHLLPGVNAGLTGSAVNQLFGSGIGISALGQRDLDNKITLDGAPLHNSINNATRFLPSLDAIQEFNVQTGIYSAEFGGQSGAQVNIALKSGANDFRGTVFHFLRNDRFDARNFFAEPDAPKLPLRRNQFGGVLSGPIRQNRTFFMVNYEGLRERRSTPNLGNVPTSAMRAGDFSAISTPIRDPETGGVFPGNQIPSSRFSPQGVGLLGFIPTPNIGETAQPNFRTSSENTDTWNQMFTRIDHTLSDSHRLFGRYGYSGKLVTFPRGLDQTTIEDIPTRDQNMVISLRSVLGARIFNELKVSYNRDSFRRRASGPGFGPGIATGIGLTGVTTDPALEGLPSVGVAGFAGITGLAFDQRMVDAISHMANNFSYSRGTHFIKTGFDLQHIRQDIGTTRNPRGVLSFTGQVTGHSVADLLLGYPQTSSRGVGSPITELRQWRTHFYVLDDWRIAERLTLNLGLRYEYNSVVTDRGGRLRSVDFNDNFRLFPEPGVRAPLYSPDRNNFAPRVGLAFRPFASDRTVVRAGGGIFYNVPILNTLSVAASNPPFDLQESFSTNLLAPDLRLSDPFPSGRGQLPAILNLIGIDPDYQTSYNQAWMTNIQQAVGSDWVVDVGYTGSRAVHIDQSFNTNLPPSPGPGALQQRRPVPTIGNVRRISTDGFSTYHALLSRIEKRFNGRYSVLSSYTLSKTLGISYAANIGGITPQDPYNLRAEKGPLPHHRKHNLVISGIYLIPGLPGDRGAVVGHLLSGWQLNSILTFRSGLPLTITTSGNPLNNGGTARPNRICDGRLPAGERTLQRYFDTSCFVAAAPFTFGDSGRGILEGPGEVKLDVSVFKNFALGAGRRLELRFEAFNATNTPSFGNPGTALGAGTFGQINSTKATNRELQLAVKLYF